VGGLLFLFGTSDVIDVGGAVQDGGFCSAHAGNDGIKVGDGRALVAEEMEILAQVYGCGWPLPFAQGRRR